MDALTLALLLNIAMAVVVVLLWRGRGTDRSAVLEAKIKDLHEMFDARMHKNTEQVSRQMYNQTELMQRHVHAQFEKTMKLIERNTRELTKVESAGQQMMSFTEQLQSLERTLKNPQRRGMVGEVALESIIANTLPPESYATQHTFRSGVRADAVIFLRDGNSIAVDAKFPLENYTKILEDENQEGAEKQLKRDIKERVQETAKYIVPDEGTLDFAFMFIPSESLYYDLLTQKIRGETNLLEHAFNEYRVIIVSPTTLLAYLQTVSLGLRSLRIERHVQDVIAQVRTLHRHVTEHGTSMKGIGRALNMAVNHYNKAEQQHALIDKDVQQISGDGGEYTRDTLEHPRSLEKSR